MITAIKEKYGAIDAKYAGHTKVLRFLIAGGTAAAVNIGTLFVLTHYLGIWYVASAVMAYLISFFVSFALQKFWTFRSGSIEKIKSEIGIYFLILLINLGINTFLVFILTDYLNVFYIISQIISAAFLAVVSYFIYAKLFNTSL